MTKPELAAVVTLMEEAAFFAYRLGCEETNKGTATKDIDEFRMKSVDKERLQMMIERLTNQKRRVL